MAKFESKHAFIQAVEETHLGFLSVADSIPVWRGRKPFQPGELDVWEEILADRRAWCASRR